jgi:hypothetical protein
MKMVTINGRPNEETFTTLARVQQKSVRDIPYFCLVANGSTHGTEAKAFAASAFLTEKAFARAINSGKPLHG